MTVAQIIEKVNHKGKIGVCMDSCHISDGGYEIEKDLNQVIDEFDQIVGLEYLKAMHLNDSLNPPGSRKDRHAQIGKGHLGIDTFKAIVSHPYLKTLPMILETPCDLDGYREEIALLRGLE